MWNRFFGRESYTGVKELHALLTNSRSPVIEPPNMVVAGL